MAYLMETPVDHGHLEGGDHHRVHVERPLGLTNLLQQGRPLWLGPVVQLHRHLPAQGQQTKALGLEGDQSVSIIKVCNMNLVVPTIVNMCSDNGVILV